MSIVGFSFYCRCNSFGTSYMSNQRCSAASKTGAVKVRPPHRHIFKVTICINRPKAQRIRDAVKRMIPTLTNTRTSTRIQKDQLSFLFTADRLPFPL